MTATQIYFLNSIAKVLNGPYGGIWAAEQAQSAAEVLNTVTATLVEVVDGKIVYVYRKDVGYRNGWEPILEEYGHPVFDLVGKTLEETGMPITMTEANLVAIKDNEEFLKALAATLSPALRERVISCADSLGSYEAENYDRQQGD